MTETRPIAAFTYAAGEPPTGYVCAKCQASGVRLYRQYQTFLEHIELLCRCCALADQGREHPDGDKEHSIAWLVAAVPTEDGSTFWGWSSVPDAGVAWWDRLPKSQPVGAEIPGGGTDG